MIEALKYAFVLKEALAHVKNSEYLIEKICCISFIGYQYLKCS